MKSKTIMFTLLAVSILLLATACALSEQELREQEYIETAREATAEIPLSASYCPSHGIAYEPEGDIEIKLLFYNSYSGEPIFHISYPLRCPGSNWFTRLFCSHEMTKVSLYAEIWIEREAWGEGEIWSSGGYFRVLEMLPLSVLTDDTVKKYWR